MDIYDKKFLDKMNELQKFLKENDLLLTFDKGNCGIYLCSKNDERKMRLADQFDGNQQ